MPGKFLLVALAAVTAFAQERGARQRIDVQSYLIDAQIDPAAQTLNATALVRFTPLDDTSSLTFELNNALNLSKVIDEDGRQIPASRMQQDMSVRLTLPQMLKKGKLAALTFVYDGKLTGTEESPVFGIKFAAIHPEFSYFMYPARWFPVNDYTTDRFSSDLKVTVPSGFKVVSRQRLERNRPCRKERDAIQVQSGFLSGKFCRGARRSEADFVRRNHD